jgi:hypothetical protein
MPITWADYARTFAKCYVQKLGDKWIVYLPDDTTFESGDLELIRAKATEHGCEIMF